MTQSSARGENFMIRALYLLAIIFVVDGHTPFRDMFDWGGLFGYYSFHLMLFAFGSGYLLCEGQEAHPLAFIARKARRLLIPLLAWNVLYGVGAALLRRFGGFELGEPLSAYTLLLAPFTDGQHFAYNLGSWFVFPLFLVQAMYILVRRLVAALPRGRETAAFVLCLIPGALAVNLCYAGQQAKAPLFLLRALILLPGYALGVLYHRRLERLDTLPTVPWMTALIALRALFFLRYENLSYLLSDCSYYPCGAFGVYAGGAVAIAFYVRVARLLAPAVERNRALLAVSRHTFDIMMHHYMGFFALDCVFLLVNWLGVGAADFSVRSFRTQMPYLYAPGGHWQINALYVLAGLALPLVVRRVQDGLGALIRRACTRISKKKSG